MIRRITYLVVLLIWLVIMCFPIMAFAVAIRGQVAFGAAFRIFLVQEDNRQGLGIQWNRQLRDQDNCTKSSIRYFLWEGGEESQNVDYCQCYESNDINDLVTGVCTDP